MGQGFAPPPTVGGVQNAPSMLGRNPNTYINYMTQQHNQRLADIQNNSFTPSNLPIAPNQTQQAALNGYLPQQLPPAPVPPQQPNGLTSLPGAGEFKL